MAPRKTNFLQKLFSREVHGTFLRGCPVVHNQAIKLFGGIPTRFTFVLQDLFAERPEHILVGTTRCGQFLITYTYVFTYAVKSQYKYRLHWWAFRGTGQVDKVAEVQLFDCQEVPDPLIVGVAQWPNVNDRLIVYGYSEEEHNYAYDSAFDSALANRNYFITVTTLPSLHNCRDCKAVAESFDEEDIAFNLFRGMSFSCLKHGLTIHTTLDVAPPYPNFDPTTNLKIDNKIIVNTGNFLHVLSFALDKERKTSAERDTIVADEISHRIGDRLSFSLSDYKCPWNKSGNKSSVSLGLGHRKTLSKSINKAWLNTIMDRANKVYAFEDSDDGCEPRFKWYKKRRLADKMYEFCSDDEDMENKRPPAKISRVERNSLPPGKRVYPTTNIKNQRFNDPVIDFNRDRNRPMNSETSSTRFRNQDADTGTVSDKEEVGDTSCRTTQTGMTQGTFHHDSHPVSSTSGFKDLPSKTQHSAHDIPPLDISVINPDLSAILAEWEADSVSSLSPRSDSLSKNDVIQSFLELIPGITISPRSTSTGTSEHLSPRINDSAHSACKMSSPNTSTNKYSPLLVVLRTRNCNQDIESQKIKEQEEWLKVFPKEEVPSKVKSTKEPDVSLRQRMISGCSIRFDRLYIELDDEIISTISTESEDDDQGFNCALPLSVHGSAYAQLQMVPSQKAEKLSMDCERVFQTSLDIEQFCCKAADIICQCEGFKFWFCSDYDVELIDVCAFNSDILGVVCMRIDAEKIPNNNENNEYDRYFYGIKCVFVWNPVADRCWLEAYSPLVQTAQVGRMREAPARMEAERLRNHLHSTTLFTLPSYPPIRSFQHRMWDNGTLRPSIQELRDYKNLFAFKLVKRRSIHDRDPRTIVEFWG